MLFGAISFWMMSRRRRTAELREHFGHEYERTVERYGDEARAWAETRGRRLAQRLELAGETAFCYARDAAPLLADLATQGGVRYLHRPANLEDLFIKLTGRELRDL